MKIAKRRTWEPKYEEGVYVKSYYNTLNKYIITKKQIGWGYFLENLRVNLPFKKLSTATHRCWIITCSIIFCLFVWNKKKLQRELSKIKLKKNSKICYKFFFSFYFLFNKIKLNKKNRYSYFFPLSFTIFFTSIYSRPDSWRGLSPIF